MPLLEPGQNTHHLVHARSSDSRLFVVIASAVENEPVANFGDDKVGSTGGWRSGSRRRGGRDRWSRNRSGGRGYDWCDIGDVWTRDLGRRVRSGDIAVGRRRDLVGRGRNGDSRRRRDGDWCRRRRRGGSRSGSGSGSWSWSRSASSTIPDGGSRRDEVRVFSRTAVDAESLEIVVHVVDCGELVSLRGEGVTGANDIGLEADGVDLRSTDSVETYQAVSNEVVAIVSM